MKWPVLAADSGKRLIDFLAERLQGQCSKKELKGSIEHNKCLINGRFERFASTLLFAGDTIVLNMEYAAVPSIKGVEKERILFEDPSILVYDKPSGINCDDTGILSLWPASLGYQLVHRLDRDTTGVLLLAKSAFVLKEFVHQFKELQVEKRYVAAVDGLLKKDKGFIESYFEKKKILKGQTVWGSVSGTDGLYAYTAWECIKRKNDFSLVYCFPRTGRTHQIRVHMAEMGHPILGDGQYGSYFHSTYPAPRLLLHAERLQFSHPISGQRMCIEAPIPLDFPLWDN